MNTLIKASLTISTDYQQYKEMVTELVQQNGTTGNDTSEAMVEYTKLNDRRMKRWDKTIKVSEEAKERLSNFDGDVTWLVLTESWCGDAAHVIPAIHKIASLNDHIDLKLILRDDNDELMNQFLTNGGKSIPKLIMIDNITGDVIDSYGPRPSKATQLVNEYKATHGALTPKFKEDLQYWYNADKGQNVIEDMLDLLNV
ncbi:MAG: thioredoxin family protein [Aquaticitalea sp.]